MKIFNPPITKFPKFVPVKITGCTWATDAITYTTAIRNIQNPDLYTNVLDIYILLFETINFHSEKLKIFITKLRFIMVCFVEGREFWGVV